jgi:hypothetical protein
MRFGAPGAVVLELVAGVIDGLMSCRSVGRWREVFKANLPLSVAVDILYYRSETVMSARNPTPDLTRAEQENRNVRRYM